MDYIDLYLYKYKCIRNFNNKRNGILDMANLETLLLNQLKNINWY